MEAADQTLRAKAPGRLSHSRILEVQAAIVSAQLGGSRVGLLAGIQVDFVTSLPVAATPSEQLLSDLATINAAGTLTDGSDPLRIWLGNAVGLARARTEHKVFDAAIADICSVRLSDNGYSPGDLLPSGTAPICTSINGPNVCDNNLTKGIIVELDRIECVLRVGDITDISDASDRTAVILPANTSFVDDCMTDLRSALGAFVQRHYRHRTPELRDAISTQLPKISGTIWPPGTTVILPRPFDLGVRVLLTASTEREPRKGIRAEPTTVLASVREIFAVTADERIEQLRMPILGSGHGGMDLHSAALFLVLGIQHYGRMYHHIKRIEIIVLKRDEPKLSEAYRLAYVARLKEKFS